MGEPTTDNERRWWWPGLAVAGLVMALFAGLAIWGLAWGVPSPRRKALEGGRAPALPPGAAEQAWQHWGSRGRKSAVGKAFQRHLFNPIRSYHPDEYQVFKSLSHMRPRRLSFDPGNYIYPSLHTYLVGGAIGACSLLQVVELKRDMAHYFEHPGQLGRMYVVGRTLSLLAALGALALLWRVGERMGRGVGLLAMTLLAAMPALMVHVHNLTRDTLAALAVMLLFACCLKLAEKGTARWYDLSGAAAGLCVATQYFAAALWVLIPVAAWLYARREGWKGKAVASGLGVSLVVMAAVVFLTCPYHFVHADRFIADFASETTHVQGGLMVRVASLGWATHVFRMMPALVTWPLTAAVCVGLVVALVRRRDADVLLLAWFVVWAGIVGLDGRGYSRYYVPLLSGLALMGSRGVLWVVGRLGWRWARVAAGAVVVASAVVPAAIVSAAWARLYALENVRTLAGEWIAVHVAAGSRVGVTKWPWQFELPPLDPARYRLVVLEESARGDPEDVARLLRLRPDYFVTSSLQSGRMGSEGGAASDGADLWRTLSSPQLYRECYRGEVPLRVLGRVIDLASYPEDMRYVNPAIYVFERATAQARAPAGRVSP